MAAPKKTAAKLPEAAAVDPTIVDKAPAGAMVVKEIETLPAVDLVEEDELTPVKQSPWVRCEELSDEDMTAETVNISAAGISCMLLRFRVDGRLTGFVEKIDRMHYNPAGKSGRIFVAR